LYPVHAQGGQHRRENLAQGLRAAAAFFLDRSQFLL
jgi:hypothetical protein